jgi:hypothetical protein
MLPFAGRIAQYVPDSPRLPNELDDMERTRQPVRFGSEVRDHSTTCNHETCMHFKMLAQVKQNTHVQKTDTSMPQGLSHTFTEQKHSLFCPDNIYEAVLKYLRPSHGCA